MTTNPPAISQGSSSSQGEGCSKILWIILALFLLNATYRGVSTIVHYLTLNTRYGRIVARKYVETNPWPNTPEDAVRKCFFSIETRSWDEYKDCFEPSAVLTPVPPGPPGQFINMSYTLEKEDGNVAVVKVTGEWRPYTLIAATPLAVEGVVVVVKASKGIMKNVKLPLVDFSLSKQGWFVYYSEASAIPFNFGKQLQGPLVQPLNSNEPSAGSTLYADNGQSSNEEGSAKAECESGKSRNNREWILSFPVYLGSITSVIVIGTWLLARQRKKVRYRQMEEEKRDINKADEEKVKAEESAVDKEADVP